MANIMLLDNKKISKMILTEISKMGFDVSNATIKFTSKRDGKVEAKVEIPEEDDEIEITSTQTSATEAQAEQEVEVAPKVKQPTVTDAEKETIAGLK